MNNSKSMILWLRNLKQAETDEIADYIEQLEDKNLKLVRNLQNLKPHKLSFGIDSKFKANFVLCDDLNRVINNA
jgi:hypothetical protein